MIIESKAQTRQSNTVLSEIKYLRGMQNFLIDQRNSNRYRVMVKESLGRTAYCFSTPIYNSNTKKLIHTSFEKSKSGYRFRGSNGLVSICQNRCVFEANGGRIVITLNQVPAIQGKKDQSSSNVVITPTLNGLRFIVHGNQFHLQLKSEIKQESIRFHSTCFSVMSEKFQPFLSVATLYAHDGKEAFAPVEIKYHDKGNQTYDISFFHDLKNSSFLFEVNLYEPKMFQDTTVESLHAGVNNAYGGIGFIGKTKQFGEQWLYSRPDFSKISDLTSERIDKVFLHIPILNRSSESIDVFAPEKRFCSFGSTWNKKIKASNKIATSNNQGRYMTIDVTSLFTNRIDQTLVYNEGLILRKPKGNDNFIAISTGDCYSAPQILEIKFKN